MVQRYDDWDKKRYKTSRSMPWWMKKIHLFQYIGWGVGFFWAFGSIYKMLLFPSGDAVSRSLDPRYSDNPELLRENIKKRETALFKRSIGEEQEKITDMS